MKLTRHAESRLRQRGFSSFILDILTAHGRAESAPGGATRISFGRKEAQAILQEIKAFTQMVIKAKGSALILKGNHIITAHKRG